jgi:probable rRNA maturation factor
MGKAADPEEVFVANAHPFLEVDHDRVHRAASAVLCKERRCRGGVNIVLATDADLVDLNSRYLGRDGATDVLSFPMAGDEHRSAEEQILGEVYISLDRAWQQAKEYQVDLAQEVDRLVIHGLLHLCGYDHEDAQDARRMKAKEEEFLEKCR